MLVSLLWEPVLGSLDTHKTSPEISTAPLLFFFLSYVVIIRTEKIEEKKKSRVIFQMLTHLL